MHHRYCSMAVPRVPVSMTSLAFPKISAVKFTLPWLGPTDPSHEWRWRCGLHVGHPRSPQEHPKLAWLSKGSALTDTFPTLMRQRYAISLLGLNHPGDRPLTYRSQRAYVCPYVRSKIGVVAPTSIIPARFCCPENRRNVTTNNYYM